MWLGPQFEGFLKTYPNRVDANFVPNMNLEFQGSTRYDGGQLAQATIQALDKKHGANVVVEIRQLKPKECRISIRQAKIKVFLFTIFQMCLFRTVFTKRCEKNMGFGGPKLNSIK